MESWEKGRGGIGVVGNLSVTRSQSRAGYWKSTSCELEEDLSRKTWNYPIQGFSNSVISLEGRNDPQNAVMIPGTGSPGMFGVTIHGKVKKGVDQALHCGTFPCVGFKVGLMVLEACSSPNDSLTLCVSHPSTIPKGIVLWNCASDPASTFFVQREKPSFYKPFWIEKSEHQEHVSHQ